MVCTVPAAPLTKASIPAAVVALGGRDRHLKMLARRVGAPPLWARRPGFATLVRIMLEQQVSLASGRAAYERLRMAAHGRVTAPRVARLSERRLRDAGLTRQKASYCRGLARRVVDGHLELRTLRDLPDDEARVALIAERGIGPWTADLYLLMALQRPDVWPAGDLALPRAAAGALGLRSTPTQEHLARIARRWAPWRAVAARLLWHAYLIDRASRP